MRNKALFFTGCRLNMDAVTRHYLMRQLVTIGVIKGWIRLLPLYWAYLDHLGNNGLMFPGFGYARGCYSWPWRRLGPLVELNRKRISFAFFGRKKEALKEHHYLNHPTFYWTNHVNVEYRYG
ncbi:MAG: hypothetical protein ACLU4N_21735 [Butyricimonas faecihominis]